VVWQLQRMKRNNVLPHTLIGGALTLSLLGTMSWNCSVSADEPLTGESETAQAMAVGDYDANDAEPEGQAGAQAVKASSSGSLILDPESQLRLKPGSSRCQVKAPEQKAGSSISKYKPGVPCVPLMLVDDPTTLIVCDKDSSLKADKRTITLSHDRIRFAAGRSFDRTSVHAGGEALQRCQVILRSLRRRDLSGSKESSLARANAKRWCRPARNCK
jgi:hypothetical protein